MIYIPFIDVDVGDRVLAWDEATGSTGYFTVTATWAHEDPVTVLLTIDGETIETTPDHPFLTDDGSWVVAGELTIGGELRNADGAVGVVDAIAFAAAPQVMYNMTVADAHTYVVGDGEWVVHNACGKGSWTSAAGLIYGIGSKEGNRVLHVFEHLSPNLAKPKHSVFNVENSQELLELIDEAWRGIRIQDPNDSAAWIASMGRAIGTNGETKVRIIIRPGTPNEIITAYPWQ